eukprot:Seg4332.2 transcript_id=Seg4332.2/GoldUCD/mRNA.D3Y31 product="Sodium-coupled monocarboxylate transporter 2" protein_id=Seg4332.2/GoldUCD/D3Y31
MAAVSLSVWDYLVFGLMLLLSSSIGIYYGYKGKQTTTREYLIASGSMHWIPISISLIASFISAIALMGIPSEVYTYGIEYIVSFFGYVIILLLAAQIYAPIFYQTKVTSANEYLERRYNRAVRLVGCILFIMQYILYLSVVIFAPSLALEAVAGVPMAATIISTGVVCTFYTTLGGMRAVVWTDVFQATIMLTGLIVVIGVGATEVGGLGKVLEIAKEGKRLTVFDFDPDPTTRNTFWTLAVGGIFAMSQPWSTSQVVVQRFLSASSLKNVKRALYANIFFMALFIGCCSLAGLVMYAVYKDCDLKTAGIIKSNDQIIPYFVVHKLSHLKGIPGIYIACLFSGALSSASSGLNSLAAVTLEDIVKWKYPNMGESRATFVSKMIVCGYGITVISLTFLVSSFRTMVLQLSYVIGGMTGAPNFGLFMLGMFSSRANSKGALAGVLTGVIITGWIATGSILYPGDKQPSPISVRACQNLNTTEMGIPVSGVVPYDFRGYGFPLAKLYSLSHLWLGAVGIAAVVIIGWLVSVATNHRQEKESVDPCLLFDFKAAWLNIIPKRWHKEYEVEEKDFVEMKVTSATRASAVPEKEASKGASENEQGELVVENDFAVN